MTVGIKLLSGPVLALALGQPVFAQNLSVTNQAGWRNLAETSQSGVANMAFTTQKGDANSATTTQQGSFNAAGTVQVGSGFTHTTTQTGNYQSASSFQANAPGGVTRTGSRTGGSWLTSATVGFATQ